MRSKTVLLCAAALTLAAGAAQAKDWIVSPGAKINVITPYEGADHVVIRPSPSFSVRPAVRRGEAVGPVGRADAEAGRGADHHMVGALIGRQHVDLGARRDNPLPGLDSAGGEAQRRGAQQN